MGVLRFDGPLWATRQMCGLAPLGIALVALCSARLELCSVAAAARLMVALGIGIASFPCAGPSFAPLGARLSLVVVVAGLVYGVMARRELRSRCG